MSTKKSENNIKKIQIDSLSTQDIEIKKRFGKIIESKGGNASALAREIGTSGAYLRDIASLKTKKTPSDSIYRKLASIKININWLIEEEGNMFLDNPISPKPLLNPDQSIQKTQICPNCGQEYNLKNEINELEQQIELMDKVIQEQRKDKDDFRDIARFWMDMFKEKQS